MTPYPFLKNLAKLLSLSLIVPLIIYLLGVGIVSATLTLDSTSITTDDTLKLKGGNVGVGNITPTSNLHVSGTLNVTATSTAAALSVSGASALTGALTLSNPSTNSLIYTNSTGVVTALASSTAGRILTASGTAPYFSWETTGSLANLTLTGPSTNSPIYLNSAGLIASLASSTAGKVLMATSTAPYFSWETSSGGITSLGGLTGATQTFATSTGISISSAGTTHTIGVATSTAFTWTGAHTFQASTTLSNLANNGLLYVDGAKNIERLASSTAGKVLMATSTAPYFSWETDATGGTVSTLVADGNNEITVGSTTSALTVNIANAPLSAAQTINIGSGSTGATSTSINIGGGTGANTVNIATGTSSAKTINIGTGASTTNTLFIGSGSSTVSIDGNLNLASSTSALTVNIANGTGAHAINIGTGGTNAKTINIGTAANTLNVVTIGAASSTLALTSASWTVTTAGTSTIVNKRTVNSSTFPTSPVDGQVVLLRAGNSPFDFLELTYDATYGKWVSSEQAFWHPSAGGSTAATSYTRMESDLPWVKWRVFDDAGLTPQFNITGVLRTYSGNNETASIRGYVEAINTGGNVDPTNGTINWRSGTYEADLTNTFTTPLGPLYATFELGWEPVPAGYTVKDNIRLSYSLLSSVGTNNAQLQYAVFKYRWVK